MAQPQVHTNTAIPYASLSRIPASRVARFALAVSAGSLLLAICAHISFPLFFTPVPFTLQPLAVLLLGLLLEPTVAFATLFAYLVEGVSGLPVFAPTASVTAFHLLGPSGGYLMAYPFAAALVSKLYRSWPRASFTFAALSAAAGAVIYFAGGASWFAIIMHQSLSVTLQLAVWPFLAGDALKIILAAAIATGFARRRLRRGSEAALNSARN